jgi:predicted phosphohydrolase
MLSHPLQPKGEILILAGDIVPFCSMDEHKDFFSYVSDHFESTYWIPGNHEYYGFEMTLKPEILNENIRQNVHLVNNTAIVHNSIRFVFTTLWSKISSANSDLIESRMNDFHIIWYNNKPLSVHIFNELHEKSMQFLKSELHHQSELKTIVVSHHVPTLVNYPERYKESQINDGFATELSDFIEKTQADYWIYGHHHFNTPDFTIGKTRMRTNQVGYVSHREHERFSREKNITMG